MKLSSLVFGRQTSATPLTVLHGMLGSARNWRSLGPRMAERLERMVYVLDMRNHGNSPHVSEMTFDLMARDTVEFLKERELTRTVLIGHSLGGSVAMYTTLKYPQLVDSLVVLDSSPERPRKKTSYVGPLIDHLLALDLESLSSRREADQLLQDKIPSSGLRNFLLTNLYQDEESHQMKWRANLNVLKKALSHLSTFQDVVGASYTGPTLFLGGGDSDVIGESAIPAIEKLFPSATVKHIPGAGHMLHIDKPELFIDALTKYLYQ